MANTDKNVPQANKQKLLKKLNGKAIYENQVISHR